MKSYLLRTLLKGNNVVKIFYTDSTKEYEVRLYIGSRNRRPEGNYFTTDKDDAYSVAESLLGEKLK